LDLFFNFCVKHFLSFLILVIFIIHYILWKTKISNLKILEKIKLPKNIISLILSFTILILLALIFLGPSFIVEKINALNKLFFNPTTGRFNITVAENKQPYFTEWAQSFGPFLNALILTGLYVLFFFGLVFSRYSISSIFNGENFISKTFYYITSLLLICFLIYYYVKYYKNNDSSFEKISFEYLSLFSLFVLCLISARGGMRVIMFLAPVAPIFVAYLIMGSIEKFRKTNDDIWKIILGVILILVIIFSVFVFYNFYKQTKSQAYNFVPSGYNKQWQKAMDWTRKNTPEDAVFGHWWDYGYWLQSIGKRATVLDGGNAISFWNYYMGRYVLTGDNEKDALEFLYAHNATHFLIDSSDIGKYGAFSSIGSNEDYDR